jgi:guanylate kinase
MIAPPSIEEVRRRLKGRSTETDEQIEKRMERIDYELSKSELYDYTVVNDDLETALRDVENIIKHEKTK